MKIIVDAHFPYRLKMLLDNRGHDVIHTLDLPLKNLTSDIDIIALSETEQRMVITKDSDFRKYNLLYGKPEMLLFVTTGNIINRDLFRLFEINFPVIESIFNQGKKVIELSNTDIIVHD